MKNLNNSLSDLIKILYMYFNLVAFPVFSTYSDVDPLKAFYVYLEILQNSQENTCARVFFLINLQTKTCNFIKKQTMAQVFSDCEFCEISKNTSGRQLLDQ